MKILRSGETAEQRQTTPRGNPDRPDVTGSRDRKNGDGGELVAVDTDPDTATNGEPLIRGAGAPRFTEVGVSRAKAGELVAMGLNYVERL